MKYILNILFLTALTVIVNACSDHDEPAPPKEEPTEVGRTVLVYMLASGNGLGAVATSDYDMQDLKEMQQAAEAGDITDGRLLVYHSCSNGNRLLKEVTPNGIDTLKIYTSDDLSQSYTRLNEVLDDMKELAPARDYGLILWGHGTGWLEESTVEDVGPIQTYAYGWEEKYPVQSINVTTLARVLQGRDLSFIYFDCCYMAGIEVVYQLRDAAPVIGAYPTEILGWGMPYDRTVKHFFAPTPQIVEAAKATFDFYDNIGDNISNLSGYQVRRYRMSTVSVINTSALDRLADATQAIYQLNTTGLPAGYSPQQYSTASNNYSDFGSYVRALSAPDELKDEFEAALAEVVIYENATEKIWDKLDIKEHSGLSTFIMKSDDKSTTSNYNRLEWFNDVASALIKK